MNGREKSVGAAIALVVVALIGWFVVVAPARNQASSLQAKIGYEHTALTAAQAAVAQGVQAEAQVRTYLGQLHSLEVAVPADDQVPELINELQAAANRTHVGFQSVNLSGGATASATAPAATGAGHATAFPSENFSLSFTGRYFAVSALLGELSDYVHADNDHFRATGRLLNMSSVSLSAGPKGFPQVSASVTAQDFDVPTAIVGGGTPG